MSVTPVQGAATLIAVGGTAVVAAFPNPQGGFIYNPNSAAEQGLSGSPEPLYVDSVGQCGLCQAGGTIVRIEPGGTYNLIPGQTTPTYCNAQSANHKFTVVSW